MRRPTLWLVLAVVLLVYPMIILASGKPVFPSRGDCVHPATADGDIDAVFGYFDHEREAATMRDRALELGFTGTDMEWNACGRLRVAVSGVPTLSVGRDFVEEARKVGLHVELEQAG